MTAARKKAMYMESDEAIQRIAGRLGLNDGAIPPWLPLETLGIGIIGEADCGP